MVYATAAQLAAYLSRSEGDLPADSSRLLTRASELIDQAALMRIDSANADQAAAARDATCAQVEFWLEVGEEHAIRAPRGAVRVGSLSQAQQPAQLAPRARRHLLLAGLLYRGV